MLSEMIEMTRGFPSGGTPRADPAAAALRRVEEIDQDAAAPSREVRLLFERDFDAFDDPSRGPWIDALQEQWFLPSCWHRERGSCG